jgi:YVTN family beta-propeller protein
MPMRHGLVTIVLSAVLVSAGAAVLVWADAAARHAGVFVAAPRTDPGAMRTAPAPAPFPAAAPAAEPPKPSSRLRLKLVRVITGAISPKSVVASQTGRFFAQNMMYRHTVTVYDRRFRLVKTIPDAVRLARLGHPRYSGTFRGAPVEAAFSPDGSYAYVSNYAMYGEGFGHPGDDVCSPSAGYDESFVYRIDVRRLRIDRAMAVGSVPKFVATTPDGRLVLVANWCSYDLSVLHAESGRPLRRIPLGPYPRGIAVGRESSFAYVAVMGSADVAKIDLRSFRVTWLRGVGLTPRHLLLDPAGRFLYATLNAEGRVVKVDLRTGRVVAGASTGRAPRSMTIAPDGRSLYVVNYESDTVSKVRTRDMRVVQTVPTNHHPIGITHDAATRQVWVACYSGSIMVFRDV